MAKDYFRVLRAEMKRQGINAEGLAGLCGCSTSTMCAALRGDSEWKLEWMYITMDALGAPYSEMATLFPRRGVWAGEIDHAAAGKRHALDSAVRGLVDAIIANI